jgi:outer membrane protein assembly factor BamB
MPSRRRVLATLGTVITTAGCVTDSGVTRTDTPTETTESSTPSESSTEPPTESSTAPRDSQTPEAKSSWAYDAEDPVTTAPVRAGGNAIVGTKTGTIHAVGRDAGREVWTAEHDHEIQSPLVTPDQTGDELVIAVSGTYELGASHELTAYAAATGEQRWKFAPEEWWLSPLGVSDGLLFVATGDDALAPDGQTLYAISLADGREAWSREIGDPRGGVVTEQAVYVPSYGKLYAFDLDGSSRFSLDLPDYWFNTLAVGAGRVAYATETDNARGVLVVRDAATGAEQWRVDDWFVTSTTRVGERLYTGGKRLAAFDLGGDGTPLWRNDRGGFLPRVPVSAEYVFAGGDTVHAHRVDDGEEAWSWTPDASASILVPAAIHDGGLFVDSSSDDDPRNRFKFGLDASDGSHRWTFGDGVGLTDLTTGSSRVFVGGGDGTLYAIDAEDGWNGESAEVGVLRD